MLCRTDGSDHVTQRIAQFTLVVRDYDEALAFWVGQLGFTRVEDTNLGDGKRWVRIRPPGAIGPTVLLARAATDEQRGRVGDQTGGRVCAFIETDDFWRDHRALVARGVRFVRPPSQEPYGIVAVFEDLYGNRIDLIEPSRLRSLVDRLALPPPAPVELSERIWMEADDYIIKRIEYRGGEDDLIPAFLFLPRAAASASGVVVFHQHNSEWHLGKSEVAGFAGAPHQAFAPALARRGVVVLAPDTLTFEERRRSGRGTEPHAHDWLEHYNEMAYRLVRGELLLAKLIADAMQAVTVLSALPQVAPTRVGVAGHSLGGHLALDLTAIDRRVAFGCASGSVSTAASRMARGVGLPMLEVIPEMHWSTVDLLAEAARRPFLVVSGTDDPHSQDAAEVVVAARTDTLEHLHAEGGHALDARRFDAIVDWLARR